MTWICLRFQLQLLMIQVLEKVPESHLVLTEAAKGGKGVGKPKVEEDEKHLLELCEGNNSWVNKGASIVMRQ